MVGREGGGVKIELGPVRITRMIGSRVRRNTDGSVDMTVQWEDAADGQDAIGGLHLHEREVALIMQVMGKRELNRGYRG